ncbi:uncharacterized protein LOC108463521 [Gossypium arboreum]|uniref:uncharacterized protein LOC108463521 n=1 Tax=Gossypium arboreum TaxID=29729 RepID=UPI00081918DF|nr:uncharacterized protein LOC108463521 [Gossypium arboreum]XP_052880645.1 uncharacterized protein LOC108463521 [Gossypium arboreum]
MLLMELGLETCIRHKLLATSGYHSLYQWYRSVESGHFPDISGLRARMEQWTFGLYPACIKYLMSTFDVPEVMVVTRSNICKNGIQALSRGGAVIYYASVFLYFWVFSTLVVLWCLKATCISALTGFIYTLTRHSLLSELLITSHSHYSTSIVIVILKFSLLQPVR